MSQQCRYIAYISYKSDELNGSWELKKKLDSYRLLAILCKQYKQYFLKLCINISNMKTAPLFLFLLLSSICVCSQTQQGFVKTLGRPDKKGGPLSGVSIRVKGEYNPVLSKEDGTLTLLLTGKKNGDAYTLQEVKKKGYELNETDVIGRQYAYSDKVPLTIVMVSSAQLQADKQRIENNAFKVAEKNYKAKLNLLERRKEKNAISEEQYRKELLDLQEKFEKYQLLIDGLAEHYAHVDYDELNDKEREVNICIENGDLERADSLIKTMFDPIDVLKRNKNALAQLNQKIAEANTIIGNANEDMAAVLKQQEKDANYLYQLYTIALSRFDNDKAGRYIETRAKLDTTNLIWQFEAGRFMGSYLANYNIAQKYINRALNISMSKYGRNHTNTAEILNTSGEIQLSLGHIEKAADDYCITADILSSIYGENDYRVAEAYVNVAKVLEQTGWKKYNDLAPFFYEKAQNVWDCILDKDGGNIDDILSNSICYHTYTEFLNRKSPTELGRLPYLKHIDRFKTILSVSNEWGGSIPMSKIGDYNNEIGILYAKINEVDSAFFYFNRAIESFRELLIYNNLNTASIYKSIATVYFGNNDFTSARRYYHKLLDIYISNYSECHPKVAEVYYQIGLTYKKQTENECAIKYLKKALAIQTKILGGNHQTTKDTKDVIKNIESGNETPDAIGVFDIDDNGDIRVKLY